MMVMSANSETQNPGFKLSDYLAEKNSADNLRQVLDFLEDGIVAIDEEGRIFYTNQAYGQILGVSHTKVLGRLMRDLEPNAIILQVLDSGRQVKQTVFIKSVGRYVQVNIWPLKQNGHTRGAVSFFRDVTEEFHTQEELKRVKGLAEHLRQRLKDSDAENYGLVGDSPQFRRVRETAKQVAPTDVAVLILGEHGSGKEVMARAIHQASNRSQAPFIAVNCAAMPEALLESELFGYEEGAFTGAKKGGSLGKFELAQGGTLFLDEIGDMSLAMQAKLLRALQEKEIEKLGRNKAVVIDVRIIAATNRDLAALITQEKFRADLFYRLNVVSLTLPPLRKREGDLVIFCQHFMRQFNGKYNKKLTISSPAWGILMAHDWPGNVRELYNTLEYAVIMCQHDEILPEHLPAHVVEGKGNIGGVSAPGPLKWHSAMADLERKLLVEGLNLCHNNRSRAMERLGLSRRAFYRKLKQYGLLER